MLSAGILTFLDITLYSKELTLFTSMQYISDKLEGCPGTRPASMTMTFDLTELNLQMAHLLIEENNYAKLF